VIVSTTITTAAGVADTATADGHDLARRAIRVMERWDDVEAAAVIHPEATNREAADEPPAARGSGPAAFAATAAWLHSAYADLRWDVSDLVAEGDLIVVDTVMRGRHVGPFVTYGPAGRPAKAFAPTGREFATKQTHWFRLREGRVVEHWAVRDDLGHALQLEWVPPTPAFLVRSALALRAVRRAARADRA
jgi:predicted ester cyclase